MSSNILAIDFGTSHSLVGALQSGKPTSAIPIDPHNEDSSLMRTLVYFPNLTKYYCGGEALLQYKENEMEGRLFKSFKTHLPNKNYVGTIIDNQMFSLEKIVGLFLLELKKRSELHLGCQINKAIIGKPARYSMDDAADELALQRMKKAAAFAGFTDVAFVPEPLAAALEFRKNMQHNKVILIGDFGGGTSDFTILKITKDHFSKKDVLAVDGCPLAGDALDSLFMQKRLNLRFGANTAYRMPMSNNILKMPVSISDKLNKPAHIAHLRDRETYDFIKEVQRCSLQELDKLNIDRLFTLIEDQQIFSFFEEIENTKKNLSNRDTATFKFDYPDLETEDIFSTFEFENWAQTTKTEIMSALHRCLDQAQISTNQIDHVFLTGGTSRVPFIQNEFENIFGKNKLASEKHFHSIVSGLVECAKSFEDFL